MTKKGNLLWFVFLIAMAAPCLVAQENKELDAYTFRFDGFWFYSQPSGAFHGTGSQGRLDFQSDVTFNSYNTGFSRVEWRFTRKNHLYLGFLPVNQSKQVALNHTVFFQGQTFGAGLVTNGKLESYLFTPGYQYDIIRRNRGHIGVVVQLDLFYVRGSLNVAAQTLNGTVFVAQKASSTLRAPLPVAGPEFRYYLIPNSRRLFVDGNVQTRKGPCSNLAKRANGPTSQDRQMPSKSASEPSAA